MSITHVRACLYLCMRWWWCSAESCKRRRYRQDVRVPWPHRWCFWQWLASRCQRCRDSECSGSSLIHFEACWCFDKCAPSRCQKGGDSERSSSSLYNLRTYMCFWQWAPASRCDRNGECRGTSTHFRRNGSREYWTRPIVANWRFLIVTIGAFVRCEQWGRLSRTPPDHESQTTGIYDDYIVCRRFTGLSTPGIKFLSIERLRKPGMTQLAIRMYMLINWQTPWESEAT